MRFNRSCFVLTAIIAAISAVPALADDADWIAPLDKGVSSLTTSLVAVAGALIGLSIVGYGIWAAIRQRVEWEKLMYIFFGGLLVTIGPAAIVWFIDMMKSS